MHRFLEILIATACMYQRCNVGYIGTSSKKIMASNFLKWTCKKWGHPGILYGISILIMYIIFQPTHMLYRGF